MPPRPRLKQHPRWNAELLDNGAVRWTAPSDASTPPSRPGTPSELCAPQLNHVRYPQLNVRSAPPGRLRRTEIQPIY